MLYQGGYAIYHTKNKCISESLMVDLLSGFWGVYQSKCSIGKLANFAWGILPAHEHPLNFEDYYENDNGVAFIRGNLYELPPRRLPLGTAAWLWDQALNGRPHQESLCELNGLFQGFIYQKKKDLLECFTDPLGSMPLYWTTTGDDLYGSSNMGSFRMVPNFRGSLCEQAVLENLIVGFPLEGRTLMEGVKMQGPGSVLSSKLGSVQEQNWFELPQRKHSETILESAERINEAMADHARRIRSLINEPVGLALSGGRDSRVIFGAFVREHVPMNSFSMSRHINPDQDRDIPLVRKLARQNQIQLHEITRITFKSLQIDTDAALYTNGMWPAHEWIQFGQEVNPSCKTAVIGMNGDWISGYLFHLGRKNDYKKLVMKNLLHNLEFVTPHTIYNFMHESSGASWQHALDSWTNSFEYKEDMRFWETFYFERILLRGQLWVLPVVGQVALYCVPVFSYYDKKVLETYLALPLENCIDRRAHTLACALNMPSGSRIRVTGALPVPPKIVAEYPILQTTFQLAREFYHYIDRFRNRLPIREEERRSLFDHKAILNHLPDHIFQHDYIIMDVLTGRTPCNYRVIRKLFAIAAFHCHFIAGDSVNWPYPRKLYQPRITEIRHGPRPYKNDKGGLYEPK